MDAFWKSQIHFAYDVCRHASLPLSDWKSREDAFRFVRAFLEEKYVDPLDSELIREQVAYIRRVFSDECGEAESDLEYDSS